MESARGKSVKIRPMEYMGPAHARIVQAISDKQSIIDSKSNVYWGTHRRARLAVANTPLINQTAAT